MSLSQLPAPLSAWLTTIAAALDARSAPRLLALFVGALFARGRRTVTSWFRAAGISDDFRPAYNALGAAGRHAPDLAYRLLGGVLKPLLRGAPGDRLLFAIDDTPTARYGPKVQGAGIHHNPSPGPAGEKFVYGHIWVTLAWMAHHPVWDTLALPLRALLYVRAKDVPTVAKRYPWTFATKLELAVELVRWLCLWLGGSTAGSERVRLHRCLHGEPGVIQRSGGVVVGACRGRVGGPQWFALGHGGASSVACGQAKGVARRDAAW